MTVLGALFIPETYAPVLLRRRANALSKATGHKYRSKNEAEKEIKIGELFKTAIVRPWILLFREPIVLLLSMYMAIVYATLYVSHSRAYSDMSPLPNFVLTRCLDVLWRLPDRLPAGTRLVTRYWRSRIPRRSRWLHPRRVILHLHRESAVFEATGCRGRLAGPRTAATPCPARGSVSANCECSVLPSFLVIKC
jgi:hypothetical protein